MSTFEQSGLGNPPFKLVHPPKHSDFYQISHCEHCGTAIKNQYFIESSDQRISVIGIDCAAKVGGEPLIVSIKEHERVERALARQASKRAATHEARIKNEAHERSRLNGKSAEERIKEIEQQINTINSELCLQLDNSHPVLEHLDGYGFAQHMKILAYGGVPFTERQLSALVDVVTKLRSGARKNSKAYKSALPQCQIDLESLQATLQAYHAKNLELRTEQLNIRNGYF